MKEGHDAAQAWLTRNAKHPRPIEGGLWRWTLVDPPARPTMDELPPEVFEELIQDPMTDLPWLFTSREKADFAAVLAVYAARRRGWPGRDEEV